MYTRILILSAALLTLGACVVRPADDGRQYDNSRGWDSRNHDGDRDRDGRWRDNDRHDGPGDRDRDDHRR